MVPWSRIQNTELARQIYLKIVANEKNGCLYHNWQHVLNIYQYYADTDEPYDARLDWATICHDMVYDGDLEKEFRSALAFLEMKVRYSGCSLDEQDIHDVLLIIMSTQNHFVLMPILIHSREDHSDLKSKISAMVRADLSGLTSAKTTLSNFFLLGVEANKLYGMDGLTFANESKKFMEGLFGRVESNIETDPDHADFYRDVLRGIQHTKTIAKMFQLAEDIRENA